MELEVLHHQKKISEVIDFGALDLYLIEPGILVSEYKADFEITMEFALMVNDRVALLTDGKAVPHLFVACPGLSVTREVREWGGSETAVRYSLSTAIVCNQLAHRIIGNFLIKVQKPPRPTRMFSEMHEAIEWLKTTIQ